MVVRALGRDAGPAFRDSWPASPSHFGNDPCSSFLVAGYSNIRLYLTFGRHPARPEIARKVDRCYASFTRCTDVAVQLISDHKGGSLITGPCQRTPVQCWSLTSLQ